MSSMRRTAYLLPLLLGAATAGSAQVPVYSQPVAQAYSAYPVGYALNDWRRLRQSSGYSFADYARFLISNPGWPEDAKLRRWAEAAMRPGENPATVINFFAFEKPRTGTGYARLADSYAASGRMAEALAAAKQAWASDDLSATDEQAIYARYGNSFTYADHDRRTDALLFAKDATDAERFLSMTSATRRPAFAARVAMQKRYPNVEQLYNLVSSQVTTDAGLMMDRGRYLKDANWETPARQLFARNYNFTYRPADPERFLDMMLLLAGGASDQRQYSLAYNIARQADDIFMPGTVISDQNIDLRDTYPSLVWLGGTAAGSGLNRPADAGAMFDR